MILLMRRGQRELLELAKRQDSSSKSGLLQFPSTLSSWVITFSKESRIKSHLKNLPENMSSRSNALIWLFPIIGGIVGLGRNDFNPVNNEALCILIDRPVGSSTEPDTYGTCIIGQKAPKVAVLITGVPWTLTFLILVANLLRLTTHVHLQERLMRADTRHGTNDTTGMSGDTIRSKAAVLFCCNRSQQSDDPQHDQGSTSTHTQSLAMQSLVQSSMYIASFFHVYSTPILVIVIGLAGIPRPNWVKWYSSIF